MYSTGIVVHDPSNIHPDGTIVGGAANVRRLADAGVVLLPYDVDRMGERLGGYCRVGWGEGRLVEGKGARVCPMLVRIVPDRPYVYWVACCVAQRPGAFAGMRLLSDPGAGSASLSMSATDGVGESRAEGLAPGHFVLRGKRHVAAEDPGYLALDLYATAAGVAVLVTAVTQSRIDAPYP
jgi:hypothetical protein